MCEKINQESSKMVKYELVKTLLYQSEEGAVEGKFIIGEDTLWASQKVMAEIFGTTGANISMHFSNIVSEGELEEKEVSISSKDLFKDDSDFIKKSLKNSNNRGRPQKWYNLDAIISIGYRINSKEATRFRIWSRGILKQYMRKGYVLNKELLVNGGRFTDEYFEQLLEEIRDIRSSERKVYQKITDLYATAYDYNKNAEITKNFYAKVQNKLHYAVSGLTAPEIIHERADSTKEHMGLTSWRKSPDGKVYLSDAKVAKNYLTEKELKNLNRIVSMYLDYAEDRAERKIPMSMKDWAERLDKFLEFYEYNILEGKGSISREEVDEFVEMEYEKFKPIQDKLFQSDYEKFDEETKDLINQGVFAHKSGRQKIQLRILKDNVSAKILKKAIFLHDQI